jgi:hypothetical protein
VTALVVAAMILYDPWAAAVAVQVGFIVAVKLGGSTA